MKKHFYNIVSIILIPLVIISCSNSCKVKHSDKSESEGSGKMDFASPPVIVYKTNADYFDKIPVTLSEDKSEIISYPGIKDIYYKGELAYPTKLNDDYLLDNRGIDPNSAFLKLTYDEYSKLETLPSKEELYALIIDKDPFSRMYNCGKKYSYKDIVTEINELIDSRKIKKQIRLK